MSLDKQILQDVLKKISEGSAVKAVGSEIDWSIQGVNKEGLCCNDASKIDVVFWVD